MTTAEQVEHLRGAARDAADRRKKERAEAEADRRAVAEAVLCSTPADALRNRIGRGAVVRLYRMAGRDPSGLVDSWGEADRKVQQQSTIRVGEQYEDAPDHDQRVVDALMSGASWAKITEVRKAVTREYAEKARQQARAATATRTPQPGPVTTTMGQAELYRSLEGVSEPRRELPPPPGFGVSQGPDGAPLQRTAVSNAVAELGSEPIGKTPMNDVREIEIRGNVCHEHAHELGQRFCDQCGLACPAIPREASA